MKNTFLLLWFFFSFLVAHAAVPSRIVYQGRLSKSGVGAAGRHTITVQFVDAAGTNLSQSQTFDVDVPTSGDFSLEIDHIPPDADWINGLPKMRVIVGGETLTPDQAFSAAPYALVARNVENLTSDKVKLAGTNFTIDSWQSPTDKSMISASVITGTITYIVPDNISPSKIQGNAVVLNSTGTQILQPDDNLVPLTLKGHPGASVNLFEVWDFFSTPEKRFYIKASGDAYFSGNVGVGTESPQSSLHVVTNGSYVATFSHTSPNADTWLKIANNSQDYLVGVRGGIDNSFSIYDDVVHSDRFIISRSGNVGIGTATPGEALEVHGNIKLSNGAISGIRALTPTNWGFSASYPVVLLGPTSGVGNVSIGYDPSGNPYSGFTGDGREVLFRNGVQFVTPNSANTSFNLYQFVMKDGNIGINKAEPTTTLDVVGDANVSGNFSAANINAGNLGIAGPATAGSLNVSGPASVGSLSSTGNLQVSAGTTLATNSGNVGIGTSNPQAKLDVAGSINFTSQKTCQVHSSVWIYNILVPSSWTVSTCKALRDFHRTPYYTLGCIFSDSFSFGTTNGGIPSPNCGW